MSYFKTNLKYLREQKGLSKNKLGELAGVNQTTISRWENGEMTPNIDNVIDLIEALNLELSILPVFLGKDLSNPNNADFIPKTNSDFKKILRDKGIDDENITEEDAKKLIDFAIKNIDIILKKND